MISLLGVVDFYSAECERDVGLAKERLEDALVTYTGDDPSIGRLFYDIAMSCSLFHQRYGSIVEQRSPYRDISIKGVRSFMNIVELPFVRDETGKEHYHGNFIVNPSLGILARMNRETGCRAKLCGREFGEPMKYSKPYIWVGGRDPNRVADAVEILKAAIRQHRRRCNCYWEEDDRHEGRHHRAA